MFDKRKKDSLDTPLLRWGKNDPFLVRDLVRSVAIFGAAGSGKTSGSGLSIAKALAENPRISLLVLASKPEDRPFWQAIFKRAGRELLVFGPNSPLRFNGIGFVEQSGGDTRDITQTIMTVGEGLEQQGANHDHFWRMQREWVIYNAVEIVKRGLGKVSGPALQAFINTAPLTLDAIKSPEFQKTVHYQLMQRARNNLRTAQQRHDYDLAFDLWAREFPGMAEKTRSSILIGVMGILHRANALYLIHITTPV